MAEEFKGLNKDTLVTSIDIKNAMIELDATTSSLNKKLQRAKSYLTDISDEYSDIKAGASKITEIQEKIVKSSEGTAEAIKEQNKQLNVVKTLNIKIDQLNDAAKRSTGIIKTNLEQQAKNLASARDNAQELADNYGMLASDSAKLDKSTAFFDNLSKLVKDIPILKNFSQPFEKASEAARKQVINNARIKEGAKDLGKEQNVVLTGLRSMASSLKTSTFQIGLLSAGLTGVYKIFTQIDKESGDFAKAMGISYGEARQIRKEFETIAAESNDVNITASKLLQSQLDINKALGVNVKLNSEDLKLYTELKNVAGIEVAALNEVVKLSKLRNESFEDTTSSLLGQLQIAKAQTGINFNNKEIYDAIAKTSNTIKLSLRGGTKELISAIAQAKKLGLSLEQIDKTAGSLLDFESSISSELNAELLTGRQLNLEQARLYALNNDIAGVTTEIAKQGINAANFASMNRIQQEAIAEAIGLSRNELADSLMEQQALNKLSEFDGKTLLEKYETARKLGQENEFINKLGSKQLEDQLKSQSLQERIVAIQEKFVSAFERLSPILEKLITPFVSLAELLTKSESLMKALVYSATVLAAIKFSNIIGLTNLLKNAGNVEELTDKRGTTRYRNKKTGKFSKKPMGKGAGIAGLVGALGLDMLSESAEKSGNVGLATGLNIGSSALAGAGLGATLGSIVPGVGNVVGGAIGGVLGAGYGLYEASQNSMAEDFISRPGQPIQKFRKDDVIIGGTSLGGGSDEEIKTLLKELVNAVKAGGNIYLDSNKVGTAMAMGTYKIQ